MQIADREFDKTSRKIGDPEIDYDANKQQRRITKFNNKEDIRTKLLKDEIERITKQALEQSTNNHISNQYSKEIIIGTINALSNMALSLLEDK